MRQYTSFDAIDNDLKILKLNKQIQEEELKNQFYSLRNAFTPKGFISNITSGISANTASTSKVLLHAVGLYLLKRLLKKLR